VTGRIRIDEVLRFLDAETAAWLDELRREGLFPDDEITSRDAEELRVAATWVRELGVNPAGVDVALQLRRRLLCLEDRMRRLLRELAQEEGGR
jgi:alpha-D-ribose 1-methylphosphonate 5-triphosphate synthase subunit PhnH